MLPRANRLTSGEAFRRTIRNGRRAGARTVVLHYAAPIGVDAMDQPVQVGFVVSKAVGGAVVRNAVRRRLRHLMRDHLATLSSGVLVVRALPQAADADFSRLSSDLQGCLERLHDRSAA